jgi:hypothetical protein
MPRRSLPVAMTDHASTQASKKKRRAARKIASDPGRKRTKAKTKASQRSVIQSPLQLPAPRPLRLLTYVGPSQQIGSSPIAIDLPRPTEKPSAAQVIEPEPEIDIPSGCSPAAMPDDTPSQAPKQKRKHSAVRKTAGKLAPAPQIRLQLLSGVGDQIGSSASTINLVGSTAQPSGPQLARAEPQTVDAVRYDQSAPSGTRPAGIPETCPQAPRGPGSVARSSRVFD